jgi:hypothetical protein
MASDESEKKRTVFVVYGRDDAASRALFSFLRALQLLPLEWEQLTKLAGKGSPYIGEILRTGFNAAQAAVVLFTPDDYAMLCPELQKENDTPFEKDLMGQPRQSALFEAGMAMGLYEERTIFVEMGNLRPVGDIIGRYTIRLNDTPEARNDLASSLVNAGCTPNKDGSAWLHEGEFDKAIAAFSARVARSANIHMARRHPRAPARAATARDVWILQSIFYSTLSAHPVLEVRHLVAAERTLLMAIRRPMATNRLSVTEFIAQPELITVARSLVNADALCLDVSSMGTHLCLTVKGKELADAVWRNAILRAVIRGHPDGTPVSIASLCKEFGMSADDGADFREVSRHVQKLQECNCITDSEHDLKVVQSVGMQTVKDEGVPLEE